jgi:hypothetical protein
MHLLDQLGAAYCRYAFTSKPTSPINPGLNSDSDLHSDPDPDLIVQEMLGMEYRAPPYDLWQLGLTCYTLATGQDLFAPEAGPRYDITDKHLGEMTGVLGRLPREVSGTHSTGQSHPLNGETNRARLVFGQRGWGCGCVWGGGGGLVYRHSHFVLSTRADHPPHA